MVADILLVKAFDVSFNVRSMAEVLMPSAPGGQDGHMARECTEVVQNERVIKW